MLENRDRGPAPENPDPEADPAAEDRTDERLELLPMGPDDLTEVVAVEQACFQDPWSRKSFEAEIGAAPISWARVLRAGERLAGYMIAWFVEDETHLANIAVAPWARRRGYAEGMLNELIREAYLRGSRMIVLEVRASNRGAIALYEKYAFTPGGIRRNYYNHPREDAIVMVRSLRLQEAPR